MYVERTSSRITHVTTHLATAAPADSPVVSSVSQLSAQLFTLLRLLPGGGSATSPNTTVLRLEGDDLSQHYNQTLREGRVEKGLYTRGHHGPQYFFQNVSYQKLQYLRLITYR